MPDPTPNPQQAQTSGGAAPTQATPAPSLLAGAPSGTQTAATPAPNGGQPAAPIAAPAAGAKAEATATTPAEIKLTPPKDSGLTDADAAKVAEFAKANGLSQAQAEKILERDAESAKSAKFHGEQQKKAEQEAQFKHNEQLKAEGAKAFQADPDFGGAKFQASIADANRLVAKYADPALAQYLAVHPLGSDPLVLRFLARIGANLREDQTSAGTSAGSTPAPTPDLPSRWYGK